MKIKSTTTILIVEDSDDDYEACVTALTMDNNLANPIKRCETGDEALDYLHRRGCYDAIIADLPSIILLDLNLPGIDGRDVLAEIKSHPDLKKIPVIVMTSSRDQNDIEACYDAGANSYVVKPVDLNGFLEAITRLRNFWFEIVLLPSPQ